MSYVLTVSPKSPRPFRETASQAIEIDREEGDFVRSVVDSRAFQRLHDVRFLGSIDYFLVPNPNGATNNVRYTRFEHSIGVFRLARFFSKITGLSKKRRRAVYAAALLHDIGHAPFSHSLEPVFKQLFDINHHQATANVIRGKVSSGHGISKTLSDFDVDAEEVIEILDGKIDPCNGFFNGPINFDTIEGILRSSRYGASGMFNTSPEAIVEAAVNRSSDKDKEKIDSFWILKGQIYSFIVRSQMGVMADYICQELALRHAQRLNPRDYFRSETSMFSKIPEIRIALHTKLSEAALKFSIDTPENFIARSFYVDEGTDFFKRDDSARYLQTKQTKRFKREQMVFPTKFKQINFIGEDNVSFRK